ncbi:MAG: stage III sporulation protein AD [Roseburia sp.]|nr:stage III sporulation protein AD [Roseburia sp.]MCM1098326.1 stage III sporulation protein AD [Ruminococcus flavefaciens]
MQELIKIALLGVSGVMLAVQLRAHKPEYGVYIGLAVGLFLFGYALRQMEAIAVQLGKLRGYLDGTEGYLGVLLRVVGITYICEFSSGICRDAGYQAVAGQIEILGKLSVLFAGLPILFAVIEQLQSFL